MPASRETYRHGDLRRAAITASIDLIESQGLAKLSLREVSRQVGVSHGAVYHHFPDRAALLRAIADAGFEDLTSAMSARMATATGPLARLHACGLAYVQFALEHPGVFRMMFRPELTGTVDVEPPQAALQSWQVLHAAVVQCVEAGLTRPAPSELLATLCWTTVHGLAILLLDGPLRADPSTADSRAASLALADQVVLLLNRLVSG